MQFDNLTWVLVVFSLFGNCFIIKKNVWGQWLCGVSNLGWVAFDVSLSDYSQASLFAVYFVMSVCGVILWTRDKKKAQMST